MRNLSLSFLYKRLDLILIISFVLFGLYLRLDLLMENRSLWLDTAALANNIIDKSYLELCSKLTFGQSAPIGFLIVTKFIGSIFDYNEFSLIAFSFITNALSLVLIALVSCRIFNKGSRYLPVAFMALSPALIFYSTELKQYSLDVFSGLLIIYSAVLLMDFQERTKAWIFYWISGVLAIFFSIPAYTILTASFVYVVFTFCSKNQDLLVIFKNKKLLLTVFIFGIFASINLFLVFNNIHKGQFTYFQDGFVPKVFFSSESYNWHLETFTELFRYPLGFSQFKSILFLSFFTGLVSLWKNNRSLFFLFFSTLVILYLLSFFSKYPITVGGMITSRLILFLSPIMYFILAWGLERLLYKRYLIVFWIFSFLLLFGMYQFYQKERGHFHREEIRPLVSHYLSKYKDGDSTVVSFYGAPAFKYYTRNTDSIYKTLGNNRDNPNKHIKFLKKYDGTGRIWLVFSHYKIEEEKVCVKYLNEIGEQLDYKKTIRGALYLFKI
jgi:uncharacterized membrane protein